MRISGWLITCALVATAHAGPNEAAWIVDLGDESNEMAGERPPRFAFTADAVHVAPKTLLDVRPTTYELGWSAEKLVVAHAADKKALWLAADVGENEIGCGAAPCPPEPPPETLYHATVLVEHDGKGLEYVAWHLAYPVSGKMHAKAMQQGKTPPPITRGIGPGADEVVKLFESSIADPKALAASVSPRKDVVLYGSAPKERFVGGAKVKAKLAAWKLAFKVRDGIQAGVTTSKTVAWVAANVDATSLKKKGKSTPYRVLFVYEKTGPTWKLVQAHFSFVS